ncbi:MAG: PAS domain S-box protein [Deltaproteobacteria bacterium]|nr:PAS domain S-box protein [Deltaproteobacteria bacterium]
MKNKDHTGNSFPDAIKTESLLESEPEKETTGEVHNHNDLLALMSSILDSIPHAVVGLKDRQIIFANHAVEAVFGWVPGELIGKNTRVVYRSDEEYEEIARLFYPVLEEQRSYSREFPCQHKDGRDLVCLVSTSRIGEMLKDKMIVVTYSDITDRKQAEEALKKYDEELEHLVEERTAELTRTALLLQQEIDERKRMEEAGKELMYALSERVKELNCLYSIADLVGKANTLEDILCETVDLIPHAWQIPEVACARIILKNQEFRSKNFTTNVSEKSSCKQISNILAHGKKVGVVEVYYIEDRPERNEGPFLREERSLLDAIAERLGRTAERKWTEEALQKSQHQQKAILDNIPDMAWLKDTKSCYIAVNDAFDRVCGVSQEDIVGMTDYDIWPPDLADKYREDDKKVMECGRRKQVEEPLVDKNGRKTWLETIKTPIFGDRGEIIGTAGIARDITLRKRAEEELKKRERELEAKTRNLEEVNIALKVLLKRREEDKTELEEKVLSNVRELVDPYVDKLKKTPLSIDQTAYVNIIETSLNDIVSPFLHNLRSKYLNLTPREIQITNLIREGKTTKEIAKLLNSSQGAIDFHRNNIRNKLGLKHKNANLRSYLLSLS